MGAGGDGSLAELGRTVVRHQDGVATVLDDVADLRHGQAIRRGAAALDGKPAVVMRIQKQPRANTLELTGRLDAALDELDAALPAGMSLYRKGFRQADFIRVALDDVMTPEPPAPAAGPSVAVAATMSAMQPGVGGPSWPLEIATRRLVRNAATRVAASAETASRLTAMLGARARAHRVSVADGVHPPARPSRCALVLAAHDR